MTPRRQLLIITVFVIFLGVAASISFENRYRGKIYPGVSIGSIPFGGKTHAEALAYWLNENEVFQKSTYEFRYENSIATLSGLLLNPGFDATLSATQAFLVGRSGYFLSDFFHKFFQPINLPLSFTWEAPVLEELLETFANTINMPVSDALFQFHGGKVTLFKPSKSGKKLNSEETIKQFRLVLAQVEDSHQTLFSIPLIVETIEPSITTSQVNSFGIQELIGQGFSTFIGSIPGRIHNIVLAASRVNGILIKPNEIFSFNDALGDISAATGYQSAYIIKDGRTVLGDGGGVCQVSTTLFRAALAAGLPVVERYAHAYRVHFYEDGGFKPGLDATVYAPNYDLKIKNDTQNYILIQAIPDTKKQTLRFELYGSRDGRTAQILNHKLWDVKPAPPPLYQDDPTLPPGVVKQVDWAATGAKASFDYIVKKNGQILTEKTFFSNFRPWQAVYLQGPQP